MKSYRLVFFLVAAAQVIVYAGQAPAAIVERVIPQTGDSSILAKKQDSSIVIPTSRPAPSQKKLESADKKITIEEEDLLVDEGDVKKHAANQAAVKDSLSGHGALPMHTDSAKAPGPNAAAVSDTQNNALQGNKAAGLTVHKDSLNTAGPVREEKKPLPPPTVESVRSINFAKNLKDYRSPKVAMFLSLIVPGLGQAYTKHYVKAGVFVALEATAIGLSVACSNLGKKKYDEGIKFANQNFDFNKFNTYYNELSDYILRQEGGDSAAITPTQEKLNGIYFDTLHGITAAFNQKSAEFYRDLEGQSNPYVQGWKDCEPTLKEITEFTGEDKKFIRNTNYEFKYLPYPDPTDSTLKYLVVRFDTAGNKLDSGLFGYSPNQSTYSTMISKSNDYYKLANTILTVMIINHLVSAVDALIGAMSYNNHLLGRESFWQHINIEPKCAIDPVNPSFGMALRMGF